MSGDREGIRRIKDGPFEKPGLEAMSRVFKGIRLGDREGIAPIEYGPIKYGPFPFHTYDNPMLDPIIKRYSAPNSVSGDALEKVMKAGAMGAGAGIFYQLCYFPWYFNDPVEISGAKSRELIRSQWPRFFRGFGRPMFWFTSSALVYSSVESLMADESTVQSTGTAGFLAGFWLGTMTKRIDTMFLTGASVGALMAMVQFNGMSYVSDPKQYAMTLGGKRPMTHVETDKLAGLKEKYPEYADL